MGIGTPDLYGFTITPSEDIIPVEGKTTNRMDGRRPTSLHLKVLAHVGPEEEALENALQNLLVQRVVFTLLMLQALLLDDLQQQESLLQS